MNDAQKKWTQKKIDAMQQYMESHFPLTDEQWNSVTDTISKIVTEAKGNAEVREMLLDFISAWDLKGREYERQKMDKRGN